MARGFLNKFLLQTWARRPCESGRPIGKPAAGTIGTARTMVGAIAVDRPRLPQHGRIRQHRIADTAFVGATGAVYGLLGAAVGAILRIWPMHEAPPCQVATTWYMGYAS